MFFCYRKRWELVGVGINKEMSGRTQGMNVAGPKGIKENQRRSSKKAIDHEL